MADHFYTRHFSGDAFGKKLDLAAGAAAQARWDSLCKPPGSLGALEIAIVWLAEIYGTPDFDLDKAQCTVFIGDHGVAAQGVSPYPSEVNQLMAKNFAVGGAVINQICALQNIAFQALDVSGGKPTADISAGAALTEAEFSAAFTLGAEAVSASGGLLIVGEMGIGNTTCAVAIICAALGLPPELWVGAGAGAEPAMIRRKTEVIAQALAVNDCGAADGVTILRKLGGYEFAAMAGAICRARRLNIPVLADGVNVGAVLVALRRVDPRLCEHVIAGHVSAEKSHRLALDHLGLRPLLDLDLRLGEAGGAAFALPLLRSAVAVYRGAATLDAVLKL